jgi:DNA-3-methyladenine glycosylase II
LPGAFAFLVVETGQFCPYQLGRSTGFPSLLVEARDTVIVSPGVLNRASLLTGVQILARRDRRLRRLVARHGAPPLWARPRGFATLLQIILEQQVSLASAKVLYSRLVTVMQQVTPASVLALGMPGLQGLGLTKQKASYACDLAERVRGGQLSLQGLVRYPDGEACEQMMQVRGIGPWTASIYLLMALRRPDIWPPGDLALQKALGSLEGRRSVPSTLEADLLAARWRPLRAVAARILWHAYLASEWCRPSGIA